MQLIQGDCLELMQTIPDKSVDLVLTDPPYGTTACKWDSVIPLEPMWAQIHRVIKENGAITLTATPPFSAMLGASNISQFRYSWYWEKPPVGQLNSKRMPLKNIEEVLVFYAKQPTYNPQFTQGKPYTTRHKAQHRSRCYGSQQDYITVSDGIRYPKQILQYSKSNAGFHPTQKPVALLEYLIRTYTNEGETVLDFTMGSGSTGVACVNTNRNFIGIELDADYFKIAEKRIADAQALGKQVEMKEEKTKCWNCGCATNNGQDLCRECMER